jgi:Cytochrome b562
MLRLYVLLAALALPPLPAAPPNGAIEQAMKQIEDSLKQLEKGVTPENHAAMLDELSKLETAIIAAKGQVPGSAEKVEEKKRAAFVADYRKTLVATLRLALDAETAIADGKYKDADGLIRNKLSAQKSAGHSKFKTEGK